MHGGLWWANQKESDHLEELVMLKTDVKGIGWQGYTGFI
jgi:hypothetical protein